MKNYSWRKCRSILRHSYKVFQKKRSRLSENEQKIYEANLHTLDNALLARNKHEATTGAKKLEALNKEYFPKTLFDHLRELATALSFAIIVAFLIRQFWFELYEVPTGSMRPTIEEQDRLVVSKTTFGITSPFRKKPYLQSDDLIKRTGIIVFTVEDMDVTDADMLYFNLIPGKKRYIKRCVAKPGDTLYFYGGHIYAVDKQGEPVLIQADHEYLTSIGIERIEHIPYISMDGKLKLSRPTSQNISSEVTLNQMNLPLGKLEIQNLGKIEGRFFNGVEWVQDQVESLKFPHSKPVSYSDMWGIGNFAMARLLTKEQAQRFYREMPEEKEAVLYLEMRHTPNLSYPKPTLRPSEMGYVAPMITPFASLLPLKQSQIDTLKEALFTGRFFVKNGRAYRYQEGGGRPQRMEYDPKFPGIPDGCYEFYYGVGYKVHFGGILTKLQANHPLYSNDPELVRKLFNLGLGFNTVFEPVAPNQPYNPQRFAYYRDGNLIVMGTPLFKKTDPALIRFVQKELEKQNNSSREEPYIAFIDHGPPLKEDGSLDIEFIQAFGLKVPEDSVVALGDNYAMSADSRDFGFVPVENLRGAPSFTFWPFGSRIGPLPQPSYPWLTPANLIVWILAALVITGAYLLIRRRNRRSIFPK